jgi:hypothetical protein
MNEQPREDLLREARAYVRRLLFVLPQVETRELDWVASQATEQSQDWKIFVGIRESGAWSIYFNEQPVLQFNDLGHLRRLYQSGRRYSAEGGRLVELTRTAVGGRVSLIPVAVDVDDYELIERESRHSLRRVFQRLAQGLCEVLGQYPEEDTLLLDDIGRLLERAADEWTIAHAPHS